MTAENDLGLELELVVRDLRREADVIHGACAVLLAECALGPRAAALVKVAAEAAPRLAELAQQLSRLASGSSSSPDR